MKLNLYVAAYTNYPPADRTNTEGLYLYQMDESSGSLERIQAVNAGQNPSFIAVSSHKKCLYVCNESKDGEVSAFAIDPNNGMLRFLNRQKAQGADPCYASLDPDRRWLLAACYSSGNISVFPLEADGRLGPLAERVQHEGSGPNRQRQEKAHAHCIRFDPSGKNVLAVDLGMDQVLVYYMESQTGKLTPRVSAGFHARPGAGPRHLAYHPSGQFIYVANELDSTVTACAWDGETGAFQELQTLPTLSADFAEENSAADIHLTPNGELLYVSNRGENSLAAFRVDGQNGHLTSIGSFSCGGSWPRNFAIDPSGRFVIVANQKSANLVVLRIGDDGTLAPAGQEAVIVAPVCVIFT